MTQIKYINVYEDTNCKFISDEEYDSYQAAFEGRDSLSTYIETVGIVRPVQVEGKENVVQVLGRLSKKANEGKEAFSGEIGNFRFDYRHNNKWFIVTIEAETLNKALIKFATYYHNVEKIAAVNKL